MKLGKGVVEMVAEKGKEFTLSLDAAMGYGWETKFDKDMLELKEKGFELEPTGKIGAGRKQRFTFVPTKAGDTDIVMIYKRRWEENILEEKRYHLTIVK